MSHCSQPSGAYGVMCPGGGGQQPLREGTGFLLLTPKATYCKTTPQKTRKAKSDKWSPGGYKTFYTLELLKALKTP